MQQNFGTQKINYEKNYIHGKLYTHTHISKAESRLSKQLLSNFQGDNSCDLNQVEAEVKDGAAYKKSRTDQKVCV